MPDKNEQNRALKFAIKLLGLRRRSVFEMEKRLEQKRFAGNIIKQVLDELNRYKYLDDEKFAESFINDEINLKNHGRLLIIKGLREKRIAEETINKKMEELLDKEKELVMAKKAVEKKMKTLDRVTDKNKIYRRISFYLRSRGYPSDIISQILKNDIE